MGHYYQIEVIRAAILWAFEQAAKMLPVSVCDSAARRGQHSREAIRLGFFLKQCKRLLKSWQLSRQRGSYGPSNGIK